MKKLLIAAVILVATCTMASAGGNMNRLGAELSVQNSWDIGASPYGWDSRHPRLKHPGAEESPYGWDSRHPRLRHPGAEESPYGWDGRHPRLKCPGAEESPYGWDGRHPRLR